MDTQEFSASDYTEVRVNIPMPILIGSALREEGYQARAHDKSWDGPIYAGSNILIGKSVPNNNFFTKRFTPRRVALAGYLSIHADSMGIICPNILDIEYLREVGQFLQIKFNRPVVVSLNGIEGPKKSSSKEVKQLESATRALQLKGQQEALISFVEHFARSIDSSRELISVEQNSIWINEGVIKRKLAETSFDSTKSTQHIVCVVYREDLIEIAKRELNGLAEALQSKGISVTSEVQYKS